jgi:hypothetical protein
MPSPVGHALAGFAIGLVANAPGQPATLGLARPSLTVPLALATLAALPDADLLVPHFHRMATHSLGATALVIIFAAVVTGQVTSPIPWRFVLGLGAAHASHVLLDWLGADRFDPAGIQALWPLSRHFYISGWDVFPTTERRLLGNPQALIINARALFAEVVIVGPVVVASWLATRTRRSRGPICAPDVLPPPCASAAGKGGTSDPPSPR